MKRCDGCGRPLGLRHELECPCWLSYNPTMPDERGRQMPIVIPPRLLKKTRAARKLRRS